MATQPWLLLGAVLQSSSAADTLAVALQAAPVVA